MKTNLPTARSAFSCNIRLLFPLLLLLLISLLLTTPLIAQNKLTVQAKGKITGVDNEPLPNVSVQEKGTSNGVLTKEDGSFSLNVSDTSAVLLLSMLGYASQEIVAAS